MIRAVIDGRSSWRRFLAMFFRAVDAKDADAGGPEVEEWRSSTYRNRSFRGDGTGRDRDCSLSTRSELTAEDWSARRLRPWDEFARLAVHLIACRQAQATPIVSGDKLPRCAVTSSDSTTAPHWVARLNEARLRGHPD